MGDRKQPTPIPDPPPPKPPPPPAPPAKYAVERRVIAELEKWIDDLQSGMWINCVYCGHRYGPGTQTPMRKALESHIATCPKHPLSAARLQVADLVAALESAPEPPTEWRNVFGEPVQRAFVTWWDFTRAAALRKVGP